VDEIGRLELYRYMNGRLSTKTVTKNAITSYMCCLL
jgi:hypothetical protein